jgi:hypothetical protein
MDYPPKVRMSDAAWLIKTLLTGCFSSLRGRNYSRDEASVNDFNKTNFFIQSRRNSGKPTPGNCSTVDSAIRWRCFYSA